MSENTEDFKTLDKARILELMPQQPPYLFLDGAKLGQKTATAFYKITGDEYFLAGHFRHRPVMPASVMIEALGQLGVLFLLDADAPELPVKADPEMIFFTSCDDIRCSRICSPGDILEMKITVSRLRHPLCMFRGTICVGTERAVSADKISLTFDILKK